MRSSPDKLKLPTITHELISQVRAFSHVTLKRPMTDYEVELWAGEHWTFCRYVNYRSEAMQIHSFRASESQTVLIVGYAENA